MDLDGVLAHAPVDWTDARVRALHDAAVTYLPYVDEIEQVASAAGIPPGDLPLRATARKVWYDAFNVAAKKLLLPALIDATAAYSPAFGMRLGELRQQTPALPRSAASRPAPGDYKGFSDGARRERQIVQGLPTLLDVRFLALGVARAKAVCRIEARLNSSTDSLGTGFRIGERRILTNHHVVFDEEAGDAPAESVQVQFGKELGVDGVPLIPVTINGLGGAALRGERADDWAIVDLAEAPPADVPILRIDGPRVPVRVDDRVAIVQHPKGLDKKIGLTHNLVRYVDSTVVQYWTDTDEGSSGAPVFNEAWEVVALHHASVEVGNLDQYGYRNQGRAIQRIAQRVKAIAG